MYVNCKNCWQEDCQRIGCDIQVDCPGYIPPPPCDGCYFNNLITDGCLDLDTCIDYAQWHETYFGDDD